jgi:SSS family solute:Na+ symporter
MLSSMFAALQGTALVAAITVARIWEKDESRQESATRSALVGAGVLAFIMASALPSVVGLWYAVGSAVVPGLLLPLLSVYFPALRIPPKRALISSVAGCALSLLWLSKPAFALEPLFPGLAASALIWFIGKRA